MLRGRFRDAARDLALPPVPFPGRRNLSFYTDVVAVVWVAMSVIGGAAAVPHALNVLPTAAGAAVLCGLVIAEIVGLPGMLLPGGTMTLLAGPLIGAGRPALAVAVPVAAAVIAADHLAYLSGLAVIGWWRRRMVMPTGRSACSRSGRSK